MVSQFFGLNIAASGLRAANAALNTTANNISNANTDGYSRQKVTQEANNALRVFSTYGCAGAGVDTIAIDRIRDDFYDSKFRNNETLLGNYKARNYYNGLVEEYLEDDGKAGFSSLFNKMEASLESVMTAAGTTETKSTFVSSLKSVTEYFNNAYASLQSEQADINAEIKLCADRVSAIAQEVASLNKQINIIEMTGTTANELRDKRDVLVDELSTIISVETKESPIVDETQPDRDTGATRFQIWVGGAYQLVDCYEYKQLICVARAEDGATGQNDVTGLYDLKWGPASFKDGDNVKELANFLMDSELIGGELQGLIAMRDGNNTQYFHGSVQDGGYDSATKTLTVTVDEDYLKDMTKATLPDAGTIKVGGKYYKYDSFDYNGDDTYIFHMDEASLTSDPDTGKSVHIGYSINYQGIPYYLSQMNEWLRRYSDEMNKIMVSGYTSDSIEGVFALTGRMDGYTSDSIEGVFALTGSRDENSAAEYSYEQLTSLSKNKGYYKLRGGNFTVNSVLLDNSDRLATKADITEGESEFANLTKLKDMINTKKIFRGATSGEFLTKVLADVALNKSNSQTLEDTYNALHTTIENQRLSESGVDEDEEASNLVKFQNAYTLSSKMIQTLTEIYDRLILQTGV